MANQKKNLLEENKKEIEKLKKEIEKSDSEIDFFCAKLKVENKMALMEDAPKDIEENIKYSAQALESMLLMEKNRNAELKKDFEILNYRKKVINKFEDEEL